MQLRHILTAADASQEGRTAVQTSITLAGRAGARLTVLTVAGVGEDDGARTSLLEGLRVLVRGITSAMRAPPPVDVAVAAGLPAIEIVRFADENEVDLVVAGRKRRSDLQRLLIGDTADSLARRSSVPCLFVPQGDRHLDRLLVALDGTERGLAVLVTAMDFARAVAGRLHAVSVEPAFANESGAPRLLTGRSERLAEAFDALRRTADLGRGGWENPDGGTGPAALVVHRGSVVDEILHEAERSVSDVLILGYHRGGPAGIVEAGSVARRLAHEAQCAVLTVPL